MFVQHLYIDGVLGHQVGDELVAVDRVELVGLLKAHAKEFTRDPVPEGGSPRLVDHPAQLGEDAVAETRAVPREEQIARPAQQQPEPAGPRPGVQGKPADPARAGEGVWIGHAAGGGRVFHYVWVTGGGGRLKT